MYHFSSITSLKLFFIPRCAAPNCSFASGDLLSKLGHQVPLVTISQSRGDEFAADVRFGEAFLVHRSGRNLRIMES